MRKIILIVILLMICFQTCVFANVVSIVPQGNTVINSNNVLQTYLITLDNIENLKITPQTNSIINEFNPAIQIPLNSIYILKNNESFSVGQNKTITLQNEGLQSFPITFKMDNTDELEEGIYSFNLLFSANSNNFPFSVKFTIPNIQTLSANTAKADIKVQGEDVFKNNKEFSNVLDTQINIKSNSKWELYLDTYNLGLLSGDYYFQTIKANGSNINLTNKDKIKLEPAKSYLVAMGDKTSKLNSTFINIKYSLKNSSKEYLKRGVFYNNLTYRIEKK